MPEIRWERRIVNYMIEMDNMNYIDCIDYINYIDLPEVRWERRIRQHWHLHSLEHIHIIGHVTLSLSLVGVLTCFDV